MGRQSKNEKKEKGGRKLSHLFGRSHKSSARIKQPEYLIDILETYRPIGRVNPRHVQGSRRWDVKYLGCIPQVKDWQSPSSRSEFMEMVDEGQMQGHLMWHSLTPKMIHINQRWMVITDDKKVMYAEFLVASIGSLAYAEDDGRHILGIKVARSPASVRGGVSNGESIGCHVLECDSESTIRDVCSSVNEQFLQLVAQEEERQRQAEQAAAHTMAPVKTKMLRRISKAATEQSLHLSHSETTEKKKGNKKKRKFAKKHEADNGKKKSRTKDKTHSTVVADQDFVLLPLNNSGLSDASQLDSGGNSITGAASPLREAGGGEEFAEEIGKQFLAVTKTPIGARKSQRKQIRGPKLKRLSTTEQGSLSRRTRNPVTANLKIELDKSSDSLAVSTAELLPPLAISQKTALHNGNVITQELEDTNGIEVPDIYDLLSTRSKTRLPLAPDSFPNSASNSQPTLELSMENSPNLSLERGTEHLLVTSMPAPPPPQQSIILSTIPPFLSSPTLPALSQTTTALESGEEMAPKHKSRTSQLLETREDGEAETMIGGGNDGAILEKTLMSEKETIIIGDPTVQMAENKVDIVQKTEKQKQHSDDSKKKALPNLSVNVLTTPEPQQPKERKPWPILIRVDDPVRDPTHKAYIFEVSKACGLIQCRQFRLDWLNYQRCQIDVVAFCKKTKLLFRGDKQHLRQGAKVLVDKEDQKTFQEVLDGTYVETAPSVPTRRMSRGNSSLSVPSQTSSQPAPSGSGGVGEGRSGGRGDSESGGAGKGGGVSNRLQMFEKPSKPIKAAVELPSRGRSVRDIINASEAGALGKDDKVDPGIRDSGRTSNVKKLASFLTAGNEGDRDDGNDRPKRGGLLSKIAAFEGGNGEEEEEEAQKLSPPPTTAKKGRGKDDTKNERRERDDPRKGREKEDRSRKRDKSPQRRSSRSHGKHEDHERDADSDERKKKNKHRGRKKEDDGHHSRRKSSVDESETDHKKRRQGRRRHSRDSDSHSPSPRKGRSHHGHHRDRKRKETEMNDLPGILAAGERLYNKEESVLDALSQLLAEQQTEEEDEVVTATSPMAQSNQLAYASQPYTGLVQGTNAGQEMFAGQEIFVQQPQQQQPHHVQGIVQQTAYQPQQTAYQPQQTAYQPQQTQPVVVQSPPQQQQQQVVQLVQDASGNVYALTANHSQVQMTEQQQQQQYQMIPTTATTNVTGLQVAASQAQHHTVPMLPVSQGVLSPTSTNSPVVSPTVAQAPAQPPSSEQPTNLPTGQPELISGQDQVDLELEEPTLLDSEDDASEDEPQPPPTPPPPPDTGGPPPPPPPPPPGPDYDIHAQRDNLLDQIRSGRQLKSVSSENAADSAPTVGLLAEIQAGKQLKKVSSEATNKPQTPEPEDGLIAELKAGKKLRKVSENERNAHAKTMQVKKENITIEMVLNDKLEKVMAEEDRTEKRRQGREKEDEGYSDSEEPKPREHRRSREHHRSKEHHRSRDHARRERERYDHSDRRHRKYSDNEDREEKREHRRHDRESKRRDQESGDRHKDKKHRHHKDESESSHSSPEMKQKVTTNEKTERENKGYRRDGSSKASSKLDDTRVSGNKIPAWRQAILDRKQAKAMKEEDEPDDPGPPLTETVRNVVPTVETYQGILPDEDPDTAGIPQWKRALMNNKMNKIEEEIVREQTMKEEEEEAYKNMPAWKRNIMKKRREEQAASDTVRQKEQDEWESKMAEIASMPPWKKKLFLERNPQYKTDNP